MNTNMNNQVPSLTSSLIARGGRPAIKKECATDTGYGHANRELVRKLVAEMHEREEYDPRYDYRATGQDNMEDWQIKRRKELEAWEMRGRFTG